MQLLAVAVGVGVPHLQPLLLAHLLEPPVLRVEGAGHLHVYGVSVEHRPQHLGVECVVLLADPHHHYQPFHPELDELVEVEPEPHEDRLVPEHLGEDGVANVGEVGLDFGNGDDLLLAEAVGDSDVPADVVVVELPPVEDQVHLRYFVVGVDLAHTCEERVAQHDVHEEEGEGLDVANVASEGRIEHLHAAEEAASHPQRLKVWLKVLHQQALHVLHPRQPLALYGAHLEEGQESHLAVQLGSIIVEVVRSQLRPKVVLEDLARGRQRRHPHILLLEGGDEVGLQMRVLVDNVLGGNEASLLLLKAIFGVIFIVNNVVYVRFLRVLDLQLGLLLCLDLGILLIVGIGELKDLNLILIQLKEAFVPQDPLPLVREGLR
mmetsp:Transcript_7407/g.12508  ORF Transcript_7407/g.12508 Transcript_7407/m.12508 type:complete len:377 (-) Transcript_7407:205-1335(-)